MYTTTVKKRDLFFKYLEEEGLVPHENYSILEVAPSIIVSQSLLLTQKYGKLYRPFLVSKHFDPKFDDNIRIFGTQGTVECRGNLADVKFDFEGLLPWYKLQCYLCYLSYHGQFDTLLIQGQPEEAYALLKSNQFLLFGDVCEIGDREPENIYRDLYDTIKAYNPYGDEYELCHDVQSKDGAEYYLIRSKILRKPQ